MTNDTMLLEMLRQHKKNSIETLIRKYSAYVGTIVYNAIGSSASREDVEEVVQDVFVAIWNNAESIQSLKAYIATTARNMALNKLRSVTGDVGFDKEISDVKSSPAEVMEKKELSQLLYEEIVNLGEPDSELFFRFYYNNERIRDIAEDMGINSSTIKSKLKRGKEKLSQRLKERRELL